MKIFIVLSACLLIIYAKEKQIIDFSAVLPGWQQPIYRKSFEAKYPEATKHQLLPVTRIYRGQEATPHQFPYMVLNIFITSTGQYFCGGSLISTIHVLTAAHCAESAVSFKLIFGAHYFHTDTSNGTEQIVEVSARNKIVHPGWNIASLHNDIALIRLNDRVTLNAAVRLVQLPRWSHIKRSFGNETGIIAGWGRTESGKISNVLRYIQNPILSPVVCAEQIPIWPEILCFSGINKRGTCSGDSGAPIVITYNDGFLQIGVHSFGAGGCGSVYPKGSTRVTSYLSWILNNSNVIIEP